MPLQWEENKIFMKIIPQADNAEEVEFISNNVLFSSVFVTQYGSKFWNTLNLDPDPEFWPNLELDTDSELSYQFWKEKKKKLCREIGSFNQKKSCTT